MAGSAESVIVCMGGAGGSDLAGSDLALVGEATDPPPS